MNNIIVLKLKRVLVILLVLCPCILHGTLHAQIHTTSSASYRSYTTSGGLLDPPPIEFQSTSIYGRRTLSRSYSTAPMVVSNGSVKTIASSIKSGSLLGTENTGKDAGNTIIPVVPGVPDTPIGDGWDVAILLALLCIAYGIYLRRNTTREEAKQKSSALPNFFIVE